MEISVILPTIEFNKIPPFGHLYQLDKVGILDVYILLNEHEFLKAHETKFVLFDYAEPKTILEHYQSYSAKLKIQVINTGTATTEEEKLHFYLKNAPKHYLLNLFICKESMPWVSEELSAKLPIVETTEYSFIPFFKSTTRKMMPLFQSPCSSKKAIELLQHDLNPCICYQMSVLDVSYYQWLFNIFVELITLKITSHENKHSELSGDLNKLIKAYNKNIAALEKANNSFEQTHKKAYKTLDEPSAIVRWQHERNVSEKANLEDNFPKLIKQLIKFYSKLMVQENNERVEEFNEENSSQKDLIEHIEGKPFS